MSSRIVLVTGLELRDLKTNVHGVYQRFRLLLSAAASVAQSVTILKIAVGEKPGARDLQAIEQIATHWGITANVVTAPWSNPPPSRFWILEQIMRAVSYRRQPAFRGVGSGPVRQVLQVVLEDPPEAVIAHKLPIMELVGPLAPRNIPIVFDMDDVEHVAFRRLVNPADPLRDRFFAWFSMHAIRRAQLRAMRRARHTLVCSEHDRSMLARSLGSDDGRVVELPNSHRIHERGALPSAPILLFVGTFGWWPNVEAIDWFLRECWQGVLQAVPGARLVVVGKNPENIPSHAACPPGVEFTGFVDDIAAVYAQARVVICPILSGGGTRVKLVEAAAFGKPIVSTTIGAEGLGFRHEREAMLVDTAADFVDACVKGLVDDDLAARLAAGVHAHAVARFSEAAAKARLEDLLRVPQALLHSSKYRQPVT